MVSGRLRSVVRRLRQTALFDAAGLSDGTLLERFLSSKEEAAFAALVQRHGPMVLGVCRRILRHSHDADDAFQATFLVLVRKAHTIVPRERVGPWLYGVACRTSLKAQAMNSRRRAKQKTLEDVPGRAAPPATEWLALLDQEIDRLPEKYRLPIVLCDLEGKTRKQAALQMGWPEGTVATRLQHGRALVQKRLARHGLTLALGGLALTWAQAVSAAAVPPKLLTATVNTASLFAAGKVAGAIPLPVLALVKGVLQTMVLKKVKTISLVLVLLGLLGLGLGGLTDATRSAFGAQPLADPPGRGKTAPATPKDSTFPAEFLDTATVERNEGVLPSGPPPLQALARLSKDKVQIRTTAPAYQPREMYDPLGRKHVTTYELIYALRTDQYDKDQVEVYDLQRRKLDNKDMAKWLKKEIPVLLLTGTRAVDPLHLRLYKDDTLIFVVPFRGPTPVTPQPAMVAPPPTVPAPGSIALPPTTAFVPVQPAPEQPAPVQPAPVQPAPVQPAPEQPARVVDGLPSIPPAVPPLPPQAIRQAPGNQAERELAIAKYYDKLGHHGSARFYYELIRRRFPNTPYAHEADQLLRKYRGAGEEAALFPPKKEVLLGEIIIVGNKHVPDEVFLDNFPLYPGQIFTDKVLEVAEEKLLQLREYRGVSPPIRLALTVQASPSGRDSRYRDVLITVREILEPDVAREMKRFEGIWKILSASLGDRSQEPLVGREFIFQNGQFTLKPSSNRRPFLIDTTVTPKQLRFGALPGAAPPDAHTVTVGTYEFRDELLLLTLRSSAPPSKHVQELKLILQRRK